MKNKNLPSDHLPILFTEINGTSHEGIYNSALKAFVEKIGDEGPEESGISFSEDEISEWEYLEDKHNPDSDIMIIL